MPINFDMEHLAIVKGELFYNHRMKIFVKHITASCLLYSKVEAEKVLVEAGEGCALEKVSCVYGPGGMECKAIGGGTDAT